MVQPKHKPRCVVFSKGKADMTYTGNWIKQHDFQGNHVTFVLSPGDDAREYARTTMCQVIISDSFNLASKRQWAIEHLTSSRDPWLYFFEDNIKRVTCVDKDKYHLSSFEKTQRPWFHTRELSPLEVLSYMEADAYTCRSQHGGYFGGYANNDNHFFRKVKYREVAFVWSKMGYVHRDAPQWPTYINEMDDYAMVGECLKRDGVVLVNNYLYPWTKKYEGRGGSRTLEERAGDKRIAIDRMLARYPGLYRVKDRKGRPTGTEIQLCFHSTKQVQQWQSQLNKV